MRDIDLIREYHSDVADDEAAREAARNRLRAHIAGTARARRPLRKLPRRATLVIAALLIASSTAAAAGLLLSSDDLYLGSVACLDSARTIDSEGRSTFVEPTGDPTAACAALWRAGHMDGRRHEPAPALVACASADQPVVVVPGSATTCRELDLEPLPRDYPAAAAATGRAKGILQRDGDLHRPQSPCDAPREVLARAKRLLADAGMPNFPVELAGDGPCAGVYVFDRGSVARIETLSRSDARDYYDRRVAGIALDPLLARAATACVDPRRAAARVRHLLRQAGLSHVAVRVEGQGGCLAPGGYVMEDDEVVLSRTTQP